MRIELRAENCGGLEWPSWMTVEALQQVSLWSVLSTGLKGISQRSGLSVPRGKCGETKCFFLGSHLVDLETGAFSTCTMISVSVRWLGLQTDMNGQSFIEVAVTQFD